MFNSGFVKSVTFGIPSFNGTGSIPDSYDLQDELTIPIDQGNRGICVSACATDMIKYVHMVAGKTYKKHVDFYYNHRSNKNIDGMAPRNAFEIAQAYSLVTSYATVKTLQAVKLAIVANGPVLVALPVYGTHSSFWKESIESRSVIGYHAVTLVGFENSYFILRNSWGTEWASDGYTFFPYDDFNIILEAWTVFR
jgi:hypothetical protein